MLVQRNEIKEKRELGKLAENTDKVEVSAIRQNEMAVSSFTLAQGEYLRERGGSISDSRKTRILDMKPEEVVEVLSNQGFRELGQPDTVQGFYQDGRCVLREGDNGMIRRSAVHECMHSLSYQAADETHKASGLRRVEFREDPIRGRLISSSENRGINEVITDRFACQELQRQGDLEALWETTLYERGSIWADHLENTVGSEVLKDAYFDGELEALQREFDSQVGETGAWDEFTRYMDTVVYGSDPDEVRRASAALDNQFGRAQMRAREKGDAHDC
jgi:hypothetical protein